MNKKILPLMVILILAVSIAMPLSNACAVNSQASVADSARYKKYNRIINQDFLNGDNICFGRQFEQKGVMPDQKYGLIAPNYMVDFASGLSEQGVPLNSENFKPNPDEVVEKIVDKYNYIIEYKGANFSDGFYIKFKDSGITGTEDFCYLNVTQLLATQTTTNIKVRGFAGIAYVTRPMVSYTKIKNSATVFSKEGEYISANYTTNIRQHGTKIDFPLTDFTQSEQAILIDIAKNDTPCYVGETGAYYAVSYQDPETQAGNRFTNQKMTLCATNNQDLIAVLNHPQNKKVTQKQIYGSLGTGLSVVTNIVDEKKTVNQYDVNVDSNKPGGILDYSVIARQVAKIDIFREAAKHTVSMTATQNGSVTLESDGNVVTDSAAVNFTVYDNSSVKFTFSPNPGYSFLSCLLNGESVINGGSVIITRDMTGVTMFETTPSYTMSVDKQKVELPDIFATDIADNIGKQVGEITIKNTGTRDICFNGTEDIEFVTLYLPAINDKIAPNDSRTVKIAINNKAELGLNEKTITVTNQNSESVAFTVSILLKSKMSIDKTNIDFGRIEYSNAPTSQNIIVSNNDLKAFTISMLTMPTWFDVKGITDQLISTGDRVTLTIVPKSNLEVKTFEESITIKNSEGDVCVIPLKVVVTRKSIIQPDVFIKDMPENIYTGEPQMLQLEAFETEFYTAVISKEQGGASVQAIDAGEYWITVTLKDYTHYKWNGGSDMPLVAKEFIFINRTNHWITEPSISNYAAGTTPVLTPGTTKFGVVEYRYFSGDVRLDSAPTAAGKYRLYAVVPYNLNFNYLERNINFEVTDYAVVNFYVEGVRYGESQNVTLGANVTEPAVTPTKEGVGELQYIFAGWDKSLENIRAYTDINAVFTEKIVHNVTKIARVEATCTEDGNIEYWECSSCHKYFSDADAATVVESDKIVIPATHNTTKIARVEATCTEDGNIEYWECSVCHIYFSDADATTVVESDKIVIAATGHEFENIWSKDETNHWHKCVNCAQIQDISAHIWDNGTITTPPTADSEGVKTYKCLCGATKTEAIAILPPTDKEISNSDKNISVAGNITENSELVVSAITDIDSYKKLLESIGAEKDKIGDYLLSINNGSFSGSLNVTFNVDSKYNGKSIMILQQKADGQIALFNSVAENGKVTITVTELSAFMLAVTKDTVIDVAGCKSTMSNNGALSALVVISSVVALALISRKSKKSKKNSSNI